MKNLFQIIIVSFLALNVNAQLLEAKPVKDLLVSIKATDFKYTETGMAYGFATIKSCVYTSESMIVIKNYCFPKKDYPARGYTIISAKFGLIQFYEESLNGQIEENILKRDIAIDSFPEYVKPLLKENLKGMKLSQINPILEKLNHNGGPGCWSTNHSWYTDTADVNCYQASIADFPEWANESQAVVGDQAQWLQLMKDMETQFPK
jgi:hypothetical protein